ncbi:MAG: 7-cyano-7-deazaguanine synthase QueC [Proteobacteria bacterium]|nr:7-cyano-7-deazaguanine synthase QueC [Pseudomonadota bacterium]
MALSKKKKSIVLLSGGLDSAVSFKKVFGETDIVLTLTFDYGQRAAKKEIEAAGAISKLFNVDHKVIDLPWLKELTTTALVELSESMPRLDRSELDDLSKAGQSAENVWVPNRNGVFINIAAAFCEALEADHVVTGFNAEEAATFPDNSKAFVEAVNGSLSYSTLTKASVIAPTAELNKREIIKLALEIGAPLDLVWSCYEGDERMCGQCESCLRLRRGLESENKNLADKFFPEKIK